MSGRVIWQDSTGNRRHCESLSERAASPFLLPCFANDQIIALNEQLGCLAGWLQDSTGNPNPQ
jgi:hypothetical protein